MMSSGAKDDVSRHVDVVSATRDGVHRSIDAIFGRWDDVFRSGDVVRRTIDRVHGATGDVDASRNDASRSKIAFPGHIDDVDVTRDGLFVAKDDDDARRDAMFVSIHVLLRENASIRASSDSVLVATCDADGRKAAVPRHEDRRLGHAHGVFAYFEARPAPVAAVPTKA
jgi:hypothetical protein